MALLLLSMILTACTGLTDPAATIASNRAAVILPDLPSVCSKKIQRVTPKLGERWYDVQKRWVLSADISDKETQLCVKFYNELVSSYDGIR